MGFVIDGYLSLQAMPRRPTSSMPTEIKERLIHNPFTFKYEIEENGVKYEMPLESTRELKDFFKHDRNATLDKWYRQLPKASRELVKRTGNIRTEFDGFYPDVDYSD